MAARVNFLPLLWSHSPWCSVLVLSPVLFVGHPLASVPLPDQNGWEPLLRGEGGIWQTQVGCARGVCSSRSPISCYSLGSVMHSPRGIGPRAWIPWQYPAEQAPRKVWAVTCSCWQFDGSCDGHHTHLWGWRLQPHLAPPLTLVKVLSCCLRVHRVRGSPRQWSLSLSGRLRAFPGFLSCVILAPSDCLHGSQPHSSPWSLWTSALSGPKPQWACRQAFQAGECW